MKRLLFETKVSGKYVLIGIILSLLVIGTYFSYAMFTVSKNKNQAISLTAGTLDYTLTVDNVESNQLVVAGNTTKEFTVVLSNPNRRTARFNFYYIGALSSNVEAGYKTGSNSNTPPDAVGINLDRRASQTYTISVTNNSSSSITINLGVSTGLDYNDLTLPSNGHLFEEIKGTPLSEVLLAGVGDNGAINADDPDQTFITGTDPNNYIWYSGKLWRAVSIDPDDNSVKLITQWNISAINYNPSNNTAFEGSYMEQWLNDTSVDGFLGNLRDYENFIKTDSVWNATMTEETTKPAKTTMVTAPVGLLNVYEYMMSYSGTTFNNGYLNNGLLWWALTPYSTSNVVSVFINGSVRNAPPSNAAGARPSINLKSSVKVVSGDGTLNNPYRLVGDNDSGLSGTLLNTRYSGEYIQFGTGENTLYRIVSHETSGLTKITSAEPLKSGGSFIMRAFGSDITFSSTNTIGSFLNGEYLATYVGNSYRNMVEEDTTWYLGTVGEGDSHRLSKYTTASGNELTANATQANVGLLRLGELMAGQFEGYGNNMVYWILTPYNTSSTQFISDHGYAASISKPSVSYGVQPAMNLKSNVIITGGTGTKQDPFTIALS